MTRMKNYQKWSYLHYYPYRCAIFPYLNNHLATRMYSLGGWCAAAYHRIPLSPPRRTAGSIHRPDGLSTRSTRKAYSGGTAVHSTAKVYRGRHMNTASLLGEALLKQCDIVIMEVQNHFHPHEFEGEKKWNSSGHEIYCSGRANNSASRREPSWSVIANTSSSASNVLFPRGRVTFPCRMIAAMTH